MIYFVQAPDGSVKIGYTANWAQRLRVLQVGHSAPLKLLRRARGGSREELWLHRRFTHLRIRGEWFRYDPAMLTIKIGAVPIREVGLQVIVPASLIQPLRLRAKAEKHSITEQAVQLIIRGLETTEGASAA